MNRNFDLTSSANLRTNEGSMTPRLAELAAAVRQNAKGSNPLNSMQKFYDGQRVKIVNQSAEVCQALQATLMIADWTSRMDGFIGRVGVVKSYGPYSDRGVTSTVVTVNFYESIVQQDLMDHVQHPVRFRCPELDTEVREVTFMLHPRLLEDCPHYQFRANDVAVFAENDQILRHNLLDHRPGMIDAQILKWKLAKVSSISNLWDGKICLGVETFGLRLNKLHVLQQGLVPVYNRHMVDRMANSGIDEHILPTFHSLLVSESGQSKPTVFQTSLFLDAISAGNVDFVTQFLMKYPKSVDDCAEDGQTGLIKAIINNRIEVIHVLIRYKARVNKKCPGARNAMHYAVVEGNRKVMNLLRDMVDVNGKDQLGQTPLHLAVSNGRIDVVEILLGSANINVNVQDGNGNTPIHCAIDNGREEIVEMLVNCDTLNPKLSNDTGCIPLHLACVAGFIPAVRCLVTKFPEVIDLMRNDGTRASHMAAYHSQLPILTYLITQGGCRLDCRTFRMESVLIAALLPWDDMDDSPFSEAHFKVVKCIIDQWLMSDNYEPQELWLPDLALNSPLHHMMKIVSKVSNPHPNAAAYFAHVQELNMEDIKRHFSANWELVSAVYMIYKGADPWSVNWQRHNAASFARRRYPLQIWDIIVLLRDNGRRSLARAIGSGEVTNSNNEMAERGMSNGVSARGRDSDVRSTEYNLCSGECNDQIADVAFFPCGHRVLCSSCFSKMRYRRCPTCNVTVLQHQTSNDALHSLPTSEPTPSQGKFSNANSQNRPSGSQQDRSLTYAQNIQLSIGPVFGSYDGNQPPMSGNEPYSCYEEIQNHPAFIEMQKKMEKLETEVTCQICWDRTIATVFQCGHSCCIECSKNLVLCHMCRVRIEQRQRMYNF